MKILLCGKINNNYKILNNKIKLLNKSNHGPFDILICLGNFFENDNKFEEFIKQENKQKEKEGNKEGKEEGQNNNIQQEQEEENNGLIIPTYIFNYNGIPQNNIENNNLLNNLFLLPEVGTTIIRDLVIGTYVKNGEINYRNEYNLLLDSIKDIRYDFLLTNEWPENCHNLLPESELNNLKEFGYISTSSIINNSDNNIDDNSSNIISHLVSTIRPRYHFASSEKYPIFYQRLPYLQPNTKYSDTFPSIPWFTRFISLAPLSSSKEKHLKWIHALSLDPISSSNIANPSLLADLTQLHTACPYTTATNNNNNNNSESISTPPFKKLKVENTITSQNTGSIFFGNMGIPRPQTNNNSTTTTTNSFNTVLTPPSSDSKTLFIGGLPVNKSQNNDRNHGHGRHQNKSNTLNVEKELKQQYEGIISFRQPNGKSFAFVEFDTHENALKIIELSQSSKGINIRGYQLTVGWASHSNNTPIQNSSSSSVSISTINPLSIITSPPNVDCKTLFVGGLYSCENSTDSTIEQNLQNELIELFPGCISVKRIPMKSFAFLEFDTHQSATSIMLLYSQNNDYFHIHDHQKNIDRKLDLGWSKGNNNNNNSSNNNSQQPPGPQNNDCWFCLASPNVKTHLVVSVSDAMYLSLPRGGVTDFHVMIIPIDCVANRNSLTAVAKTDLNKYQIALEDMLTSLSLSSIRYERCIHTKGSRNHMQVHFIPISFEYVSQAISSFLNVSNKYNLHFHELLDGILLEQYLTQLSTTIENIDLNELEYFYIELPLQNTTTKRRFVYIKEQSTNDNKKQFPMHFGLEVAAVSINKPERANWKNCMVSESNETILAEKFRASFESYDFT